MTGITPEQMAKAEKALNSVRDNWLKRPGVTAVDLGFKWTGGQMTPTLSIRVHVEKKKDRSELAANEIFPELVSGIPVDVIEATYAPQTVRDVRIESAVDGRGARFDVMPLGISVGSKHTTAGTLGAQVFDIKSDEEMILSNWHVLAGHSAAEPGLSIWQPGWIDGGTRQENIIAELTRWVLGPYDAAVARTTGARELTNVTLENRKIEDTADPRLGMLVWKSSRSTGLTEGFVDGVKMTVAIYYPSVGTRMLQQVFRIVPIPGSPPGEISAGGDSGAVWVDEESGKAVGLHFAGEIGNTPEHALASDITFVTRALKVRFPAQRSGGKAPKPAPGSGATGAKPTVPAGETNFWESLMVFLRRLFGL